MIFTLQYIASSGLLYAPHLRNAPRRPNAKSVVHLGSGANRFSTESSEINYQMHLISSRLTSEFGCPRM